MTTRNTYIPIYDLRSDEATDHANGTGYGSTDAGHQVGAYLNSRAEISQLKLKGPEAVNWLVHDTLCADEILDYHYPEEGWPRVERAQHVMGMTRDEQRAFFSHLVREEFRLRAQQSREQRDACRQQGRLWGRSVTDLDYPPDSDSAVEPCPPEPNDDINRVYTGRVTATEVRAAVVTPEDDAYILENRLYDAVRNRGVSAEHAVEAWLETDEDWPSQT